MGNVTREQVQSRRPPPVPCEVEAWGGTIYVRRVSLSRRIEMRKAMGDDEAELSGDAVLDIVLECVVDADGEPMFTEADKGWLDQDYAAEVEDVFSKIADVNGWSAASLEEAEKN